MSWTYDATNVGSSDLATVRFLSGDIDTNDQLLQDQEINWLISSEASLYYAAASACSAIATIFSRKVDKSVGDLSISASQKAKSYADRAKEYRQKAGMRAVVNVYAGGISISDKDTREADTDRTIPAFTRDLFEYPGSVASSTSA